MELQKELAKRENVVMDGRISEPVCFPMLRLRFHLTASVKVRAERRYKEPTELGID